MKRVLKWIGIVLGGSKVSKSYDIAVRAVPIPAQAGSPDDGWPVAIVRFCQECHGDNLQGDVLADDPLFGKIMPPNLTSGRGGIGGAYADIDWVRSIRHGVDRDGRPLVLMPSHEFYNFSDADLGQLIAYVKSVPPVDNEVADTSLGPLGKILVLLEPELLPASVIDHDGPRPPEPPPGANAAYGEYMAFVCSICHGDERDAPHAPNLTPRGTLGQWSEEDFVRTLRSGTTPYGKNLDEEFMPWKSIGKLTDDQLKALWLYLSSLPSRESTQ